jgi:hypothetical protein
LLSIIPEVMRVRLNSTTRSHEFGQHPVTQAFLAETLPQFERTAIEAGAVAINTTIASVNQVVDKMLDYCAERRLSS